MSQYVDGFVIPVPKKNVAAYRRIARKAGKVWMEHGALQYMECVADDVKPGELTSFPQSVLLKDDETVVFSWIVFSLAQGTRPHQREGDGRPAAGVDDEREGLPLRRQAPRLRRLQEHRRTLTATRRALTAPAGA